MLVFIQNKQNWHGRNDFHQNLSLRNFCLYSQESDFMSFFVQKWKKWHGRSDFFQNLSLHNFFRDKIPILRKKFAAPSGGQWWKKKFLLEVNSEMFPGIKNVIVFSGQFFQQFLTVSNQQCKVSECF